MDIFLKCSLEEASDLLQEAGFRIEDRKTYFTASKPFANGVEHVHFIEIQGEVYWDLHFQHRLHFLFLGVNHKQEEFFEKNLKPGLQSRGIMYRTVSDSWFTRYNKAVFRGMRV